jgi:hypothetical protein
MFEIGIAALKLAGPLSRIAGSLTAGDSYQREKVAADLDNIAGCARDIALRLQADREADIVELTGRMEHFAGMIGRTLNEVVSNKNASASGTGLLTNDDVASFSERLQNLVNHLHAFDGARESAKAKEHKQVVRELKLVAGRLAAQAEELRNSKGPSRGAWQRVKPTIIKVGGGVAASWAAVEAVSAVSFERIEENYSVARTTLAGFIRRKFKYGDDPLDEDTA